MPTDPTDDRPTTPVSSKDTERIPAPPPVCCHCGRVRTATGWVDPPGPLPGFVSHSICPDCLREYYPDQADAVLGRLPPPENG